MVRSVTHFKIATESLRKQKILPVYHSRLKRKEFISKSGRVSCSVKPAVLIYIGTFTVINWGPPVVSQ